MAFSYRATLWHAFDAACAVEQAALTFYITKMLANCIPVPPEGLKVLRSCDPYAGRYR